MWTAGALGRAPEPIGASHPPDEFPAVCPKRPTRSTLDPCRRTWGVGRSLTAGSPTTITTMGCRTKSSPPWSSTRPSYRRPRCTSRPPSNASWPPPRPEPRPTRRKRPACRGRAERFDDGYGDFGHDPDLDDPDDDRDPLDRPYGAPAAYGKQVRWHRPVAWALALMMGVGMVALAFMAVYRGASSGSGTRPVPPPASTGPEQGGTVTPLGLRRLLAARRPGHSAQPLTCRPAAGNLAQLDLHRRVYATCRRPTLKVWQGLAIRPEERPRARPEAATKSTDPSSSTSRSSALPASRSSPPRSA